MKLIVSLGEVLSLDVASHYLFAHIPCRRHEVTPGPEVTTPELPPQTPTILMQMMRRLPLHQLHDSAGRQPRRNIQEQMHMVRPNVTPHNLDVVRPTHLPDQ